MKIYNKRGLIWASVWMIVGVWSLIIDIASPDNFLSSQIKHLVISIVLILIGIIGCVRAFSKTATRKDKIEEQDERNRLIKLKSQAKTGIIMFWIFLVIFVCSILACKFTENIVWLFICVAEGILFIISWGIESILRAYYEGKS